MSRISEMSQISEKDSEGTKFVPVQEDTGNYKLDLDNVGDQISINKEDFMSPNIFGATGEYSFLYGYTEAIGGVEEAAEVSLSSYPSCIEIPHNIIEDPTTGTKKSLLKGNFVLQPTVAGDYHEFETRLRILKNSDNPACTVKFGFGFPGASTAADIDSNVAFNGYVISIPSYPSATDIPDSSIGTIVNVITEFPYTPLESISVPTPNTLSVETLPLVTSLYTKLTVRWYSTYTNYYINDSLVHTYNGWPVSSSFYPMFPGISFSSYPEDYTGGGSLIFIIDYLRLKSKISV